MPCADLLNNTCADPPRYSVFGVACGQGYATVTTGTAGNQVLRRDAEGALIQTFELAEVGEQIRFGTVGPGEYIESYAPVTVVMDDKCAWTPASFAGTQFAVASCDHEDACEGLLTALA